MATNSKLYELNKEQRVEKLETELKVSLTNIKQSIINEQESKSNIENYIGSAQIPIGIAGPVNVKGDYAKGLFYLPLATTEGALIASVSRGCKAISESGGANVLIVKNNQTRSILFKANSLINVKKFSTWVQINLEKLKQIGQKDERFLKILDIETYVVGLNIWLIIKADTNDAMGMNMITISGKKIADSIISNFKEIEFISESGNMCVDKKPSAMNLINSRGKRVIATVNLNNEVIKNILKTTPEKLIDLNYRKNLLGSAAAGSLGFNAHFANIIAALFIATGQDAAHTVDGSLGFTTVESINNGINFSVTLSSLQVATVGGGTNLPTQKECLSILKCLGPNPPGENSKKLAEIFAAGVLAGEISLLSALCTKHLSSSHITHNR